MNLYKTLDDDDNEDFRFATILTTGNRERHEFNMLQSKKWAKYYKSNVIRWKRKINDRSWKGKPKSGLSLDRVLQESCFWELFVAGIVGYLTINLNTELGLANGTQVKYHSVSFANADDLLEFNMKLQSAEPGATIDLDRPPDIINVELFPDLPGDDDKTRESNEEKRKQWKYGSVTDDGTIVIPITTSMSKKFSMKWKPEIVRGFGGYRCRPSKVDCADHFPLEPGFAVTLHKAQGRTIRKVVLCVSEHPMRLLRLTWEGLYVGLSRIRSRHDIRLLIRKGDRETLSYISDLEKDKLIRYFFEGYSDTNNSNGAKWNSDLAAQAAGYIK